MNKSILSIFLVVIFMQGIAQNKVAHDQVNYEAAKWRTWLVDNPNAIATPAPPNDAQTRSELETVKQRIKNVDTKKLDEIIYWNAGAPSYRWNQITPMMIENNFQVMLRIPASWVNVAIYDATVLTWREKVKYKRQRPDKIDSSLKTLVSSPTTYSYPCEHSATAAAAAYVLAYFIPEKADSIIQLARAASQSRVDAGVQFPSDVDAGWKLGEEVAKQIIEKAKKDGSDLKSTAAMNTDPKKWTGKFAMGLNLTLSKPMVLNSADQFRPVAPPDFDKDMKELKAFKQNFKSRASAFFWANSGEFWTELTSKKMFEYRMSDDAPTVARIYAALHVAYHDMAIAIFDAEYAYWGIRPAQYDTTFTPLISTPPFPGYPAGHAAGGAASSAVLAYFFPRDAKEFQQYAQECADSRFYAGIHFRTDNEAALVMGKTIGKYVVERLVKETNAMAGWKQ